MNLFDDPLLVGLVVVIGIAIIAYFALTNKQVLDFINGENKDDELLEGDSDLENPLSDIFYLYNHKSGKDWLRWIETQNEEIKAEAFRLLAEHLNGPSKFWGSVTLEALGVMHAFKDQKAEEVVGAFLQETGRLWGEYKSIPSYYEKATQVLIKLHPLCSLRILNEELNKNCSSSQAAHDKKKIIVDALPKLEELGIGMMIALLNNSDEAFTIKSHALKVSESFSGEGYRQIILETLKKQVTRTLNTNRAIKAEESQLLQDLVKEGIRNIGQYDFFKVMRDASNSIKLQSYIINPLVKRIDEAQAPLNPTEVYAMTLLKDNEDNELRKAICKLHGLETSEINNICLIPLVTNFAEDDLKFMDIKGSKIFVPSIFKSQYDDFKALFFQAGGKGSSEDCEKSYGGVLITGDDKLEKLYFSKAFAKEKLFNFSYIDLSEVVDKESYNSVCNVFSTLRKPYILFIDNPELMFPSDKSDAATYREKFSQALYIQALDAKSLLVGSINKTLDEINDEDTLYAIGKLKKKFFTQTLEINKREERFKPNIVEDYLKFISSHRFENRADLILELVELGKEKSFMEFTFFIIDALATMLMVYGKDMPYSEIQKLQNKFIDDTNHRTIDDNERFYDFSSTFNENEVEDAEDSAALNEAQ